MVAPGIYALRGFGIAQTYALDAPGGWIIIDTADSNQLAAEMRTMLEEAVGGPIRVAAILLTHWHYASHKRLGATRGRRPGGTSVSMPT